MSHACNSNLNDPGLTKRGPSQFDGPSQSPAANLLAFSGCPLLQPLSGRLEAIPAPGRCSTCVFR